MKGSERVYLEAYTSLLLVPKATLVSNLERERGGDHFMFLILSLSATVTFFQEEFYGKPVIVADREMVEMVRFFSFVIIQNSIKCSSFFAALNPHFQYFYNFSSAVAFSILLCLIYCNYPSIHTQHLCHSYYLEQTGS